MEIPCLLTRTISGLIAVENDSGLLLAPAMLHDSAPMAEKTVLAGTFLDLSGILTIEKGNESLFIEETEPKLSILYFDV